MIVCPICGEVAQKRDLVARMPETRCLCGSLFQKGRIRTVFSFGVPQHSGPSQETVRYQLQRLTHRREWKEATPAQRADMQRHVAKESYVTKSWLTLIVSENSLYRIRDKFHMNFDKWEYVEPDQREAAVDEMFRSLKELEVWEAMMS